MGERKGVNKYYPPDFDYKKHGSLDRYHNSHPLRERAAKLSQGILIIRFEMPYNIWCNGCNKHIGMGVRYNSEKKKVGNYYSTIIYKFRMKCHLCDQYFEIQTDPANCDYKILSGARRKEERWDAKANEQIEMTDHAVKKKLMSDPMFKLEHGKKDESKLKKSLPTLNEIQSLQDEKKDDYLMNKALRKIFRDEKKRLEKVHQDDNKLLLKSSLSIKLLPETSEDKKLAELYQYQAVSTVETNKKTARDVILHQPVLKPSKVQSSSSKILLNKTLLKRSSSAIDWNNHSTKRTKIDDCCSIKRKSITGVIKVVQKKTSSYSDKSVSSIDKTNKPSCSNTEQDSNTKCKTDCIDNVVKKSVIKVLPTISISSDTSKSFLTLVPDYSDSDSSNSE